MLSFALQIVYRRFVDEFLNSGNELDQIKYSIMALL